MASDDLQRLLRQSSSCLSELQRKVTLFNENAPHDMVSLRFYKEQLYDINKKFSVIQGRVEDLDKSDDQIIIDVEQFERLYNETVIEINRQIAAATNQSSTSSNEQSHETTSVLTPKIKIEPFKGDPNDWYRFKSNFKSLVHENTHIPGDQKFRLLKNSLKGDVTSIVNNLNASSENYKAVWERLNRYYDIHAVYAHLRALSDLPELTRKSCSGLKELAEKAEKRAQLLRILGQPVDSWNTILSFLIIRKLDKCTREAANHTFMEHIPKFSDLITFILKKACEYDNTASGPTPKRRRVSGTFELDRPGTSSQEPREATRRISCYICKQYHVMRFCDVFLNATIPRRIEYAQQAKVCMNCLCRGHNIDACPSSNKCKMCGGCHHTLLHVAMDDQPVTSSNT